jgi:hypothetical protein
MKNNKKIKQRKKKQDNRKKEQTENINNLVKIT